MEHIDDLKKAVVELQRKLALYKRLEKTDSYKNGTESTDELEWDLNYMKNLIREDLYSLFDQEKPICNIVLKSWIEIKEDFRYYVVDDAEMLIEELNKFIKID